MGNLARCAAAPLRPRTTSVCATHLSLCYRSWIANGLDCEMSCVRCLCALRIAHHAPFKRATSAVVGMRGKQALSVRQSPWTKTRRASPPTRACCAHAASALSDAQQESPQNAGWLRSGSNLARCAAGTPTKRELAEPRQGCVRRTSGDRSCATLGERQQPESARRRQRKPDLPDRAFLRARGLCTTVFLTPVDTHNKKHCCSRSAKACARCKATS